MSEIKHESMDIAPTTEPAITSDKPAESAAPPNPAMAGGSVPILPPLSSSAPHAGISAPQGDSRPTMPMGQLPPTSGMPPMQQPGRQGPPGGPGPMPGPPNPGVMGGQQPDRGGVSMPGAPIKYEPQGPLPGGAVPMAPGGPAAQPQPYRQLKVEDALAYLDQVKSKFEKQPQIYNKVCACAHARCLDGACAATRSRVAPGAIVMDTLLRASRTRTRMQTHEISLARASRGSSSTS